MALFDQDFAMFSGDTRRLAFTIWLDDAMTIRKNLTGSSSVKWEMHSAPPQDAESTPLVQKSLGSGVTLSDPVQGEILVVIDPADTETIDAGLLYHELEIVDQAGDVITAAVGSVTMYSDAIT